MSEASRKSLTRRIVALHVFFVLVFGVIAARAVDLQVLNGAMLDRQARKQWQASRDTIPTRGVIYDAKYRELAVSLDVSSIAARPFMMEDAEAAAGLLAGSLNLSRERVARRLASGHSFVWLKRHATPQEVRAVQELSLEGIEFVPEKRRYYPNRGVAAQVLGFCGVDGQGLEGLEFQFDEVLSADGFSMPVVRDARGGTISRGISQSGGKNAANLVLTIDRTIQYLAEDAVREVVDRFGAKSGMAVVMEPDTGAVLAMVNVPGINPNAILDYTAEQWRNRTVTDMFEPGSTMKVFLAASALESGGLAADTPFFCENGMYDVSGKVVHDSHAYGWLSLAQVVKYSSNIGAVKIEQKIGQDRLYKTLTDFGFGERTGVQCPGETAGILRHVAQWTTVDAGNIAFGQGISVSCLQLATALSAIANGGVLMRPLLVQGILDDSGSLVSTYRPTTVRRAVSARTAMMVNRIMRTVTNPDGTGELARLEGYTVCGKTGTAQKVSVNGGYSSDLHVASFAGFAPADDPRITVVVVVDEPEKNVYGGVVAAPAFKKICEKTLQYLNVPPDAGETRRTAWLEVEDSA